MDGLDPIKVSFRKKYRSTVSRVEDFQEEVISKNCSVLFEELFQKTCSVRTVAPYSYDLMGAGRKKYGRKINSYSFHTLT